MKTLRAFILTAIMLLAIARATAQNYAIESYTIASGGGTSTGSVYSISGTLGQHEAGVQVSGANYSLIGGFSPAEVTELSGSPMLRMSLISPTMALVSWPSATPGWRLQQSSTLVEPNWTTPTESVSDDGTDKFINVNPQNGNQFFRLVKP